MPIWLILSNIKFILKLNWIQGVIICLCFSLIITTFGAFSLELGVLLKNTREASLLLLFRKKARSACLFGCKRPHNGTLSLPPFCEQAPCGAGCICFFISRLRMEFELKYRVMSTTSEACWVSEAITRRS